MLTFKDVTIWSSVLDCDDVLNRTRSGLNTKLEYVTDVTGVLRVRDNKGTMSTLFSP